MFKIFYSKVESVVIDNVNCVIDWKWLKTIENTKKMKHKDNLEMELQKCLSDKISKTSFIIMIIIGNATSLFSCSFSCVFVLFLHLMKILLVVHHLGWFICVPLHFSGCHIYVNEHINSILNQLATNKMELNSKTCSKRKEQ